MLLAQFPFYDERFDQQLASWTADAHLATNGRALIADIRSANTPLLRDDDYSIDENLSPGSVDEYGALTEIGISQCAGFITNLSNAVAPPHV